MASEDDPYKVHVIAQEGHCPTDGTCFVLGRVAARPGQVQAVARVVSDPKLLAAYHHKIGPGEILVEFTATDILEVSDR